MEILPTKDGYDRWAAIYDDEDNPLIALEEPRVDALLGDAARLRIADIGCGTGRHALRLARAGALVTAIDFSPKMMARALAKEGANRIHFVAHDLAMPLPLAPASYDRVLSCLVVDHIANLRLLFSEMHRICQPNGCMIVSVMHPAMMLRGVQARFTDPVTGLETRPESCPNQLSDYIMAAIQSGWEIDHLSEHAVDEALAARMERASKYVGWPMLFLMRGRP